MARITAVFFLFFLSGFSEINKPVNDDNFVLRIRGSIALQQKESASIDPDFRYSNDRQLSNCAPITAVVVNQSSVIEEPFAI
jgi:hypothetical protein